MALRGMAVLTVGDLSEYFRVHPSTVYRLLRRGKLPAFKVGNDWRFSKEAIERWQQQQSTSLSTK
jgi:excisionase family DNA binding protein